MNMNFQNMMGSGSGSSWQPQQAQQNMMQQQQKNMRQGSGMMGASSGQSMGGGQSMQAGQSGQNMMMGGSMGGMGNQSPMGSSNMMGSTNMMGSNNMMGNQGNSGQGSTWMSNSSMPSSNMMGNQGMSMMGNQGMGMMGMGGNSGMMGSMSQTGRMSGSSDKYSDRRKRRYDDDDEDDRSYRRRRDDRRDRDDRPQYRGSRGDDRRKDIPPAVEDVTLLFPLDGIGTVIGKGGSTIRRIQTESRAGLKLQDPKTLPDGSNERGLTISGSMSAIISAERMIFEQIRLEREDTEKDDDENEKTIKWVIPVDNCGMIIGRRGAGIDELKRSTGAYVRVATQFDMPPGSDERLVTISGDPEKCQAALDYIKDKAGGKPYEQRGWKSSTGSKGEKETVHVPLKSIGVILGSGGSEIKRITSESGANVQISTDMFIGDTKRIVTISGDDESREKAKVMIQERVAVWEQEYGHSEGDSICLKMVIPYVLIGHVLGKGGAFMRDVSNQCNVSVKINQDKGTFSRLCDSRPVMMIGTLENIFEAQRMIYDRLLSAPSNQLEEASRLSLDAPGGMGGMGGMGAMGGMGGMGMGGMEPMTMMMNGQKVMVIPQNMMMGGMQQPMMMMGGGMPGMGMSMGMMQQDVPVRPDKSLGIMGVKKHSQGMNVWIHPICMKYIIGKGGSNIKQLARDSGCEIEAQEKDEVKPNQNGVMIDIKGPGDNALMGFKLIHECLTGIKKSLNPLEKLSGDN
mmetsp:Transcript_24931/g.31115  ORF Transcript_24931/g.31115 Transcript_24931/m.31115 type:complete len:739 (-) Transcript_24931:502-2718(-)